jgi:hypothetical protein
MAPPHSRRSNRRGKRESWGWDIPYIRQSPHPFCRVLND